MDITCNSCGFVNHDDAGHCVECGNALVQPQATVDNVATSDATSHLSNQSPQQQPPHGGDPFGTPPPHGMPPHQQPQHYAPFANTQPGPMAFRSGNIKAQCIIGWILFVPSTFLTILFLIIDPVFALIFLIFDIWSVVLLLYFTIQLVKTPRTRIEFTGQELLIHTNRTTVERVPINTIISATGTGGNWFFSSAFHMADGTLTIQTTERAFRITFIKQSVAVAQEIDNLRRATMSMPNEQQSGW